MSIAIRRHHRARLKQVRKFYWRRDRMTPKQLGIVVATPAVCSCWMCGNERKHFNSRTVQERRQMQIDTWDD